MRHLIPYGVLLLLAGCSGGKNDKNGSGPQQTPATKPTAAPTTAARPSPSPAATAKPAADTGTSAATHSSDESAPSPVAETPKPTPRPQANVPPPPPLDSASSPYLRAAAKMPIKWLAWSPGAFARAREAGKPVLISVGANWSHLCRQMDQETYANGDVAHLINENFTPIRVDRDERPDVDERLQAAHMRIHKAGGGYPLTVFALPDGRPFESLTFVAAETSGDHPGMRDVLQQVQKLYADRKSDVEGQAAAVEKALAKDLSATPGAKATLDEALASKLTASVSSEFDSKAMAFGAPGQPRFPSGYAPLALLQSYSDLTDKTALRNASDAMGTQYLSGLRDNVMGGYFRYSADEAFTRPRFEKLLNVQAEMLIGFSVSYAASIAGDPEKRGRKLLKDAARDVLRFTRDFLQNEPDGGFFSSQDADIGPKDDGSYFTWTAEDVQKIAGAGVPAQVFIRHFNIGSGGARSVLRPTAKLQATADALKISRDDADKYLEEVRGKLHDAHMDANAPIPAVNKTMIGAWNSMMIVAYLDTFKYLGDTQTRDFALQSMNFMLDKMISENQGVARVYANGKAEGYGFLEDNVYFAQALLGCFEVSGRKEYLQTAQSLMEFIEARFLDPKTGLYVDRVGAEDIPLMKLRRHPVLDGNTPSPNAVAAMVWYALAQLSNDEKQQQHAERLVSAAAAQPGLRGVSAATTARAAAVVVRSAPKVLVVGAPDDAAVQEMHAAALPVFRMGKIVEVLASEEAEHTDYKPAPDGKPIAYVCTQKTCAPPARSVAELIPVIRTFGKPEPATAPAPAPGTSAGARGRNVSAALASEQAWSGTTPR